ncbi:UNVERIFIED_CONTAM: hypothetical protein FKN15_023474 [Acipenser sinensis]
MRLPPIQAYMDEMTTMTTTGRKETGFTVFLIFSFPSPPPVSPPKKRKRESHRSHRLESSEQLDKLWVSHQGNMLLHLLLLHWEEYMRCGSKRICCLSQLLRSQLIKSSPLRRVTQMAQHQ